MSAHGQSASTSSTSSSNTAVNHAKTLVLCFDGTGNSYSEQNTNVVKFFRMLDKSCPDEQMVYYEPGVGTYVSPGAVSPLFENVAKTLDFMVAWDINRHITDGYRFLMRNYRDGDKICLMGFSRGAYTARALAGMLFEVGLLPRDNDQLVPFAYKLYETQSDLAHGFKLTYSRDVYVDFVGVWDTVSSVGVLLKRDLPFTKSNKHIRVFRHAMSLDERRARFQPNPWHLAKDMARKPSLLMNAFGLPLGKSSPPSISANSPIPKVESSRPVMKNAHKYNDSWKRSLTKIESVRAFRRTDVLEVWFAGSHADVGGGATSDGSENPLSDIPLRWMIRELVKSGCPIRFADAPSEVTELAAVNDAIKSLDPSCAKASLLDVLSVPKCWFWWILEFLPASKYWEDDKGGHYTWFLNFGRGRKIYKANPVFHRSVKERMVQLKYRPNAKWKRGSEVYTED